MFNAILVALDDSELSEPVVQTLDGLQLSTETKIIFVHVLPTHQDVAHEAADRPQTLSSELPYQQAEKQLQAYQSTLPYASEREIVSGDPAEEIVRLANIYQVDLIILGSRGLTGVKRILQGSVSGQVVVEASCSVLVVKPQ